VGESTSGGQPSPSAAARVGQICHLHPGRPRRLRRRSLIETGQERDGKVRPDIKVVLTSAYSQEMIAGAMNAPQIRGFIRKPFQLGDLVKKLKNTLVMG
jgi:hypothetical protein